MTALNGSVARGAVLFRMELADASPPDVINLWLGIGEIEVPINDLVAEAEIYRGVGALVGIPVLEQLINGAYARAEFSMSGVDAEVAALADSEAPLIRNAPVNVGLLELDDDWQPVGEPLWCHDSVADVLRTAKGAAVNGSQTHTVNLSTATAMSGRKRPSLEFWTPAQQKRRSPTDEGLDEMPTTEKTNHWPN